MSSNTAGRRPRRHAGGNAVTAAGDYRWLAAGLALFVNVGFLLEGFDGPFGNAATCAGFSVVLVALLVRRAPSTAFWRAVALPLGLLAAETSWAIATSLGLFGAEPPAPDRLLTMAVGRWAMLAALLCGTLLGARRVRLAHFVYPLLAVGALGLVLGFVLRDSAPDNSWLIWAPREDGRFRGTLGNANVAAAAYGALTILAVAAALDRLPARDGRAIRRIVLLALTALAAFVAVALTGSRTGTLLVVIVLSAILIGEFGSQVAPGIRASRKLVVGGAIAVVAVVLMGSDILFERIGQLGSDAAVRPLMWRHYLEIALHAPGQGYGLGAFASVNARYLDTVGLGEALWMVNAPHNLWLNIMLEAGLPGVVLVAGAIGVIAVAIVRDLRRRITTNLDAGVVGVLVLILGLGHVDIAFDVPAVAALALILAGWLWGGAIVRGHVGVGAPRVAPARQDGAVRRRRARAVENL